MIESTIKNTITYTVKDLISEESDIPSYTKYWVDNFGNQFINSNGDKFVFRFSSTNEPWVDDLGNRFVSSSGDAFVFNVL